MNFARIAALITLLSLSLFGACPSGLQQIDSLTVRTTADSLVTNACYNPTTGIVEYFSPDLIAGSATLGSERVAIFSTSLANVNAGTTLIAGVAGRVLTVTGVEIVARGGTAATCTDVRISSTNASPADAAIFVVADLVQNVVVKVAAATSSVGTRYAAAGTAGEGLQIRKTGMDCATATSFTTIIRYVISGR